MGTDPEPGRARVALLVCAWRKKNGSTCKIKRQLVSFFKAYAQSRAKRSLYWPRVCVCTMSGGGVGERCSAEPRVRVLFSFYLSRFSAEKRTSFSINKSASQGIVRLPQCPSVVRVNDFESACRRYAQQAGDRANRPDARTASGSLPFIGNTISHFSDAFSFLQ